MLSPDGCEKRNVPLNYLLLGHRKGYLASLPKTGERDRGSGRDPFVKFSITFNHPSSDADEDEEVKDKRKRQEQNEFSQQLNASVLQIKNDR